MVKKTKEMKVALEKYKKLYGDDLYLSRKNYLAFKNASDGESRFLHIRLYEKYFNKPRKYYVEQDIQIHHIDNCGWNPEIWNLIALSKQQHKKINHSQIDIGNWERGLKTLMNTLNWSEYDLPQHIREKLKNENKSRRTETQKIAPYSKIRENYSNAYLPWTDKLDEELMNLFNKKISVNEIAKIMGRKPNAITSRLKKIYLSNI